MPVDESSWFKNFNAAITVNIEKVLVPTHDKFCPTSQSTSDKFIIVRIGTHLDIKGIGLNHVRFYDN